VAPFFRYDGWPRSSPFFPFFAPFFPFFPFFRPVTERDFFSPFAQACGARPVHKRLRYSLVWTVATMFEANGHLTRRVRPPLSRRYATWLMGQHLV